MHRANRQAIRERLAEFHAVPVEQYFYEMCFCLCTPQSNALHCYHAVDALQKDGFLETGVNPEPYLGPQDTGYVRFHITKAKRLLLLREQWEQHRAAIRQIEDTKTLREYLVKNINGLGYKEASHFLRNIGRLDVVIIDRHIITHFLRAGILEDKPKSISKKRYLELEERFLQFAEDVSIPAEELDLLLWQRETGFILK